MDKWLYQNLGDAEKRQNLSESDHTFSERFERRMKTLLHPDPVKRMTSVGLKSAAVLLAAVCTAGVVNSEAVRGFVGQTFMEQDAASAYLYFDLPEPESDVELCMLPDTLLSVYTRQAKRCLNRSGNKYAVDYWKADGYAFSITVDGRGKGTIPVPNAVWQSEWIADVQVHYTISSNETCAYWVKNDLLMIVKGEIGRNTLLQIIEACITAEED